MILLYSRDADSFVNKVIDYLDDDYFRIGDLDRISIDNIEIKNNEAHFKINGSYFESLDLNKIKTIWFNGGVASTTGSEYENECYSLLLNSFIHKKKIKKIGRLIKSFEVNKLNIQLYANEYGFKTPETLITNDKDKLSEFYKKFNTQNGIICKRITDTIYYRNEEFVYDFTPTFLIDKKILKNISKNFAVSLFQERILADFEIRVVLICGKFYAMSIHTFDNTIDYRRELGENQNVRAVTFKLPESVKTKISNIFKRLNLNYGSVDLMYYNNEFYFLEINPIGQIGFVNDLCNFYIEKKISNILNNEI